MNRNSLALSPRKRATAVVATGALLALGGVLISASAANAVTQTPGAGVNYSVVNPSNPVNRASTPSAPADQFVLTDSSSKSVEVPAPAIVADQNADKIWAVPDANNTGNVTTHYGLFFYIPSTHDLVDVGSHLGAFANATNNGAVAKAAFNSTAATAELESLAPGTEYDVIIGQTPFASGGVAGDPSVLLPNENYYSLPYQYDGLNTTSGVYESGLIGSTVNTAPVANTTTALTATADANGGVVLTATIEDPSNANAVDTTATGGVTFSAAGLSSVTAQVVNGIATTTIAYPTTNYATTYSFTAVYSGNVSFATSTSTAQSVTTSAAPANFGQIGSNEIVTIPAPAAGTLTLSVATGGVQFGTAAADLVHGTFSATAPLPESTVTDTRFAKGDWTLNGVSTALVSGANSIPATDLSWAAPTITTPAGSGAVAGSAAASLAAAQSLATFHNGALLGQIITKADTSLSLTTPINQAQGTYSGTLTITLL